MMIRAYLRASTTEQDASRAKNDLKAFVESKEKQIASYYQENVSGTHLERPELDRLIRDAEEGDILLIEKVDRLTRLPFQIWEALKQRIKDAGLKIVVLDQPQTHSALEAGSETVNAVSMALTNFMLDLAAAMARDDYETRLKRQKQGIEKAKENGKYKGRKADIGRQNAVRKLLASGITYTEIMNVVGCSRGFVSGVSKKMKEDVKV